VTRVYPVVPESERWLSKVDRRAGPDSCWPWTGKPDKDGYGSFKAKLGGRWCKVRAHRWGYEHLFGPLGDLQVRHTCDNPPCCNPGHWIAGTNLENIGDRDSRGRTARQQGERHPQRTLTESQVVEIRHRVAEGERRAALASEFRVTRSTIGDIVSGRTWRHLPPFMVEVQAP
jgi:hypothetical protein